MRILYVDTLKAVHAQSNVNGLKNAFRKIATKLDLFDYRTLVSISSAESVNKTLFKYAKKAKPDLIFLGKCESIYGDTIKLIKEFTNAYVVSFLGDFYWEPAPFKIEQSQYADINLFSYYDIGIRAKYKEAGATNIGYWNDGYDIGTEKKMDLPKTDDVIFLGSNYLQINNYLENYQFRYNLMKQIDDKFNLTVYGKGWDGFKKPRAWVHTGHKTEAVNRAKITVGVTAVDNAYLYLSWPRVFQTMACGTLHLTQYVPGLEKIFTNRKHIVWFRTVSECLELIDYYLKHDDEREAIAEAGRALVVENHSYDNRIRGIADRKIKDEEDIFAYLGTKDYPL